MQAIDISSDFCSHNDLMRRTLKVINQKLKPTHCFVAAVNAEKNQATTLCYLVKNEIVENFSYPIEKSPCETLINSGQPYQYMQDIQETRLSPLSHSEHQTQAYLGVLIHSKDNYINGIIVCLFDQNMTVQQGHLNWITGYSEFFSSVFWQQKTVSRVQQLEKRLAEIEGFSHVGSWSYDIPNDHYWCSNEMHRILGIDKESIVTFKQKLDLIHPQDKEEYLRILKSLESAEISSYDFIHRIVLADGQVKYILEKAELKQKNKLNAVYIEGKIQDITQLYQLNSDKKLHNFVLENTSEAVMITNSMNRIVFVNKAMLDITGYSNAELLDQDPSILSAGEQSPEFYQQMWEELQQKNHWRGEIYNRRKDGAIYPEELSISIIRDKEGSISNYVAIFRDISLWKKREKKLKFYAEHDPLTGLINRRVFLKQLSSSLKNLTEEKQLAILFIDVDDFKLINDIYGHDIGDLLLKSVGQRIENVVLTHGLLCRYGGDEFTILLNDINLETTQQLVNDILVAFHSPFHLQEHVVETTVSIGIDISSAHETNAKQLLSQANYAMRNAKKKGRNSYSFHNQKLQQQYNRKLQLKESLKQALNTHILEVHYQPIYDIRYNKITKFEALVRWPDSIEGFISPAEFISIAEEYGLIQELGNLVCNTACKDLKRLHQLGFNDICFSINRSIKEFVHEEYGQPPLTSIIKSAGIPFHSIIIEITESVAMSENHFAKNILADLREKGIKIALDDFCTGYSSLNYLIDYDIDIIKIDRSFIKTLETDSKTKILTSTVLKLAEQLNLEVVAEGVEKEAQLSFLRDNHCQNIQGYYFSPALRIDECINLLQSNPSNHE